METDERINNLRLSNNEKIIELIESRLPSYSFKKEEILLHLEGATLEQVNGHIDYFLGDGGVLTSLLKKEEE